MRVYEFTTPMDSPLNAAQVRERLRREFKDPSLELNLKRSIDSRHSPQYRYRCELFSEGVDFQPYSLPEYKDVHSAPEVLVVGAGPAGMFAALHLLMAGLKPVILERGKDVHNRKRDLALISREGILDEDSNYCFGEGGAGTFSDGKLYTRSSKRGDNREVLHQFVRFGASEDILIESHPHLGSDRLPAIVENIRKCILEHGGEYHFNSRICSMRRKGEKVELACKDGARYEARAVILACGHSGKDVYEILQSVGGVLQAKGFALGVRVEHPQSLINEAQYRGEWREGFPAAEYSFVQQVEGRGVFSFCMCPGGVLVPSSTESRSIVLNGMSNSARSSIWANSGVVVQIEPEDVAGDSPLRLLDFQMQVERDMWAQVQSGFTAPAQRMVDFCKGRISSALPRTSYAPGIKSVALHEALPGAVSRRLRKAFPQVKIKGYYTNEALLLGVESRTSSPVRIPRNPQTLEYEYFPGVYPCGEGAGYAGGIVSSAVDGIRAAESIAESLKNN